MNVIIEVKMKRIGTLAAFVIAAALGVAACGGGGGSASTSTPASARSTSPSPAPSHTHAAQRGEPALIAVPGYDYADFQGSAGGVKEVLQRDPEHFLSASAHEIQKPGGLYIGHIILVKIKPQYDNPATTYKMQRDLAETIDPRLPVTQETIHGEKVVMAKEGANVLYTWYHKGTLTVVTSYRATPLRDFVEAYLQAAHR